MIVLGLGVAYLVATGNWMYAAVLVFALPAFITLLRFPFITLIIWLLLAPFLVQTPTTAERAIYWLVHRLLPFLTLGVMIILSVLRFSKRQLPRLSLPDYAMLGYVGVSVISIMLQSNSVSATLIRFFDRVFIPMCLFWIIRFSAPTENTLKWLIPVTLYLTFTQVVIGTISWIAPGILPAQWTTLAGFRTTGSLSNPSVFSITLIFSGIFLLYAALKTKNGWLRNLLILGYAASIYSIFLSFNRSSWLAAILVLFGVFILYPKFIFRMAVSLLPFVLLLSGPYLATLQTRLFSDNSTQSALSRLPVMLAAYRMFEAKPVFGWGYDNFDRYDLQFQGRVGDLINPVDKDLTSHNMFLTLLAEQGLVGFTLFLAPVLWLLIRTIGIHSRLPKNGLKSRNMTYLLWLVNFSFIIEMNFHPIGIAFGLGLYWVTLGLISNSLQPYSLVK